VSNAGRIDHPRPEGFWIVGAERPSSCPSVVLPRLVRTDSAARERQALMLAPRVERTGRGHRAFAGSPGLERRANGERLAHGRRAGQRHDRLAVAFSADRHSRVHGQLAVAFVVRCVTATGSIPVVLADSVAEASLIGDQRELVNRAEANAGPGLLLPTCTVLFAASDTETIPNASCRATRIL
jgi:hypothetical protein